MSNDEHKIAAWWAIASVSSTIVVWALLAPYGVVVQIAGSVMAVVVSARLVA